MLSPPCYVRRRTTHFPALNAALLCENKIDVCGAFLFISTHTVIDFLSPRTLTGGAGREGGGVGRVEACASCTFPFYISSDTRDMASRIHDIILLIIEPRTLPPPHEMLEMKRNRRSCIKRIQLKATLPP